MKNFTLSGMFFAISSAASYGLMSFLVHLNPSQHPVEQLIFLRGFLSLLALQYFLGDGWKHYFRKSGLTLWIRSLAGAGGIMCYFYTLQGTSSGNANLLFSSSPIFVSIFAYLLFRERLSRLELSGIFLIVLGNVLLYIPNQSSMPLWVWLTASAGAIFSSIAFLSLGSATKKYNIVIIVWGFAAVSGILALISPSKPWLPLHLEDLPFLFTVSFLGLYSQLSATLSFAKMKSSVATAIGRSAILFSALLDIFIARYEPKVLEWVSYLVVIGGIWLAHQKAPPPQHAATK